MYEAFYGLRERPFNLTPDPKFLYLSEKHKEAFAHLLYGIKNRSGFVMLSGEIGTGKTTICRNLLNQLDADTKVAFIFNPALNPIELMKKINQEFGVDDSPNTLLELVDALNKYLLESAARGINNVLVIDESQNLEPEVLEQIRLLSNLETETDKLLQIILIGQPELAEKLSLHRLRQLNQRITARYHLHELDETETMQYIAYRLHVAGGRRKVRFAKGAVSRIHKISGGTPRVINAICDRCLLIGYTRETHTITPAIVKQAAKEIKGEKIQTAAGRSSRFEFLRPWMPSPGLVMTAVVIVIVLQLFIQPLNELNFRLSNLETGPPAPAAPTAAPAPTEPPADSGTLPAEPHAASPPQTAPREAPLKSSIKERYKHTLLTVEAAQRPQSAPPASAVEALAGIVPEDALKSAAAAMLRAWNLAPVSGLPTASTEEALADFARRNGLDAEPLTPTLGQLRSINLPAFLLIEIEGRQLWSALTAISDGHVTLSGGTGAVLELNAEEFEKIYTKQAILLWKDPRPGNRVMLQGQENDDIAELKRQLRGLGRISAANTSARYDEETATAVAQIQSETGLWLDGKAGKQVRMVLASWLPQGNTPSLAPREENAAPVRHVSVRRPEATGANPVAATAASPAAAESYPLPDLAPKPDNAATVTSGTPEVQAISVEAPAPAHAPQADTAENIFAPAAAVPRNGAKRIPAPSPYAPETAIFPAPETTSAPQEETAEPGLKLEELQTVTLSAPLDATLPSPGVNDGDAAE